MPTSGDLDPDILRALLQHDTGALIALAFPDRIAKSRGGSGDFLMVNGRAATLPVEDPLSRAPFLAIAEHGGRGANDLVDFALRGLTLDQHSNALVESASAAFALRRRAFDVLRTVHALGCLTLISRYCRVRRLVVARPASRRGVLSFDIRTLKVRAVHVRRGFDDDHTNGAFFARTHFFVAKHLTEHTAFDANLALTCFTPRQCGSGVVLLQVLQVGG